MTTNKLEVMAWIRKWSLDGEKLTKKRNKNGRMAYPMKYKLHEVTRNRCLPDDVALYTAPKPAEQQPDVAQPVEALEAVMEFGCDPKSNRGMWALEKAKSALTTYHKGVSMMLVLIRGLPGSGKSTMARALQQAGFVWLEADSYHLNAEGEYCYSPENVKAAHEWCQREVFKALSNGKRVVVSNTFTRRFEMEPYFDMAKLFGIEPNILEVTGNWPNVHGVPAEVVEKMRRRWEKVREEF